MGPEPVLFVCEGDFGSFWAFGNGKPVYTPGFDTFYEKPDFRCQKPGKIWAKNAFLAFFSKIWPFLRGGPQNPPKATHRAP